MARRRMIDPLFWEDEKMGKLPRDVRLFYIGLWNFSDDEGRFRANTSVLKGQIFPYDADICEKTIQDYLCLLSKTKRILLYSHNKEVFGWVRKFKIHQTINRPTPSKLPSPPTKKLTEPSVNPHTQLSEPSSPSEVKLSEVKRREKKLKEVKGENPFSLSQDQIQNQKPNSLDVDRLGNLLKPEIDRLKDYYRKKGFDEEKIKKLLQKA